MHKDVNSPCQRKGQLKSQITFNNIKAYPRIKALRALKCPFEPSVCKQMQCSKMFYKSKNKNPILHV